MECDSYLDKAPLKMSLRKRGSKPLKEKDTMCNRASLLVLTCRDLISLASSYIVLYFPGKCPILIHIGRKHDGKILLLLEYEAYLF